MSKASVEEILRRLEEFRVKYLAAPAVDPQKGE